MSYIRLATVSDIVRLAEIEIFNYRLNFYPIFRNDEYYFNELRVDLLAKEYEQNPTYISETLVYDDGAVKGFIRIDQYEVKKLFVEPCLQGTGIGSELLKFAIDAKSVNMLWALEKNSRAVAFYARHGFQLTGERMPVDDTEEYLVCLRRKSLIMGEEYDH